MMHLFKNFLTSIRDSTLDNTVAEMRVVAEEMEKGVTSDGFWRCNSQELAMGWLQVSRDS